MSQPQRAWAKRRRILGLVVMLLLALTAATWARVGGGHMYSGGGGGFRGGGGRHGGGGGGGIGLLIELLIRLAIIDPQLGVPLLIIALVAAYFFTRQQQRTPFTGYTSIPKRSYQVAPIRRISSPVRQLQQMDPNFSRPLFLDFLGLLYAQVQRELPSGLGRVAAYLKPTVRTQLQARAQQAGVKEVTDVVVGSLRLVSISRAAAGWISLRADFETNFTQDGQPVYSVEQWTLGRALGVRSKGPDEIVKLACPNCGASSEVGTDGVCPFCETVVNDGKFGWVVTNILVRNRVPRPNIELSSGGQEAGTELATRFSPDLDVRRREFLTRNTDFLWPPFEERVRLTFTTLQEAWSSLQWERARPFETDHLFESHRYWIEAYRREGLQNRLQQEKITKIEAVRIESDAYYDAITLRIWANMLDYTVEVQTGKVVAGDSKKPRFFSEYWTFIRRTGHTPAKSQDPNRCPSCGAPLDGISQSGICSYCDTKITRGDFDWVLSQIEQDEVYEP